MMPVPTIPGGTSNEGVLCVTVHPDGVLPAGGSCSSQTTPAPHHSGTVPRPGSNSSPQFWMFRFCADSHACRLAIVDSICTLLSGLAGPGAVKSQNWNGVLLLPVRTKSLRTGSYPQVVWPVTPTAYTPTLVL